MNIQACHKPDMTFDTLLSTDGLLTFSLYTDWTTTAFVVWIGMFMLFYVCFDFCIFHFFVNATGTSNMSGTLSILSCIIAIVIASSVTSKVNSCSTNESTATNTEPKFAINVLLLCVVAFAVYTDFSVGTKKFLGTSIPLTQVTKYVSIFFLAYNFLFSQSEAIQNTATTFFMIFFGASMIGLIPKFENTQTDRNLQRYHSFSEYLSAIILLPVWIHMEGRSTNKTLTDLANSVIWVNVPVALVLFVFKQVIIRAKIVALIDPITTSLYITMAIGVFAAFLELSFDRLFYGSQIACNEISKSMSHVVTRILYVVFFALLSRHWTDGLRTDDVKRMTGPAIDRAVELNSIKLKVNRQARVVPLNAMVATMAAILVLFLVVFALISGWSDITTSALSGVEKLKKLGTVPKILSIHTYKSEADLRADFSDITIPLHVYYNVFAEKTGHICRDVFADQKDGATIGAFTEPNCGVPSGETDTDATNVRNLVNNNIPIFAGNGGDDRNTSMFVSVFFRFNVDINEDSFNYQDVSLCGAQWETLTDPIKRINNKLYYANIRPLCSRHDVVERCLGNRADGSPAMRIHVPESSFKTTPDDTHPNGVANTEAKDFMIFYLMRPKITIKFFKTGDEDDITALEDTINTEASNPGSNPKELTHDNLSLNKPEDELDVGITLSTRHAIKPRVVVLFELDDENNDFDFTDIETLKARLLQDRETSQGIIKSFSSVEATQGTNQSDPTYELLHVTYIQGTVSHEREQETSSVRVTGSEPRLIFESNLPSEIEHARNSKIAFVLKIKETVTSDSLDHTKLTINIPENIFSDRFSTEKNVMTDDHHWYHFAKMIVNMYVANKNPYGHSIAYSSAMETNIVMVPNNDELLRDETGVEGVFYIDTSRRISSDLGSKEHPFSLSNFDVEWTLNFDKEGSEYHDVNAVSTRGTQNVYWCKKIERVDTNRYSNFQDDTGYRARLLKDGIVERYRLTVKQVTKVMNTDDQEELLVPNPKPDDCSVKFLENRSCNWAANTPSSLFQIDSSNTSPRQEPVYEPDTQTEEKGMCEGVFAQTSTFEDTYRRYAANFVKHTSILIGITIFWMFTTVIMFISDSYWTGEKTLWGTNKGGASTAAPTAAPTEGGGERKRVPPAKTNHTVFFLFWMIAGTSLALMIWLIAGKASQATESALSLISIVAVPLMVIGYQQSVYKDRISNGELLKGGPFQFFVFFYNIAAFTLLAVILWFTYSQYESNGNLDSFNPLLNLDWKLKLTWTNPTFATDNLDGIDISDIQSIRDLSAEWTMNKNNTQLSKRLTGNYDINEANTSIHTFHVIFFLASAWLVIVYLFFGVIGSSHPQWKDGWTTAKRVGNHMPARPIFPYYSTIRPTPVLRSRKKFTQSPIKGFRKGDVVPDALRTRIVNPPAWVATKALDKLKLGFIKGRNTLHRFHHARSNKAAGMTRRIMDRIHKLAPRGRRPETSNASLLQNTTRSDGHVQRSSTGNLTAPLLAAVNVDQRDTPENNGALLAAETVAQKDTPENNGALLAAETVAQPDTLENNGAGVFPRS